MRALRAGSDRDCFGQGARCAPCPLLSTSTTWQGPHEFRASSAVFARNPIFGARTDTVGIVVDTKLFYRLPFESGRLQAVGSVLWGEGDSDVAFHDSEIFMINAGVMYRFGAR